MSTFDQLFQAINQEQMLIEKNQIERQQIYNKCMENYLQHLSQQNIQFDLTEQPNQSRNKIISELFENVYHQIIDTSDIAVRKIKRTLQAKYNFWNSVIKENVGLNDLELKKEFYQLKADTEDRCLEAIDCKKSINHLPYRQIIGRIQKKEPTLQRFQRSNKQLQNKVNEGTHTLNRWKNWQLKSYEDKENDKKHTFNNHENDTHKWNENDSILRGFTKRKDI